MNLREASLDGLDQRLFLLALCQLERLLHDEVAVAVADEGVEARAFADLAGEARARRLVAVLEALLDDA